MIQLLLVALSWAVITARSHKTGTPYLAFIGIFVTYITYCYTYGGCPSWLSYILRPSRIQTRRAIGYTSTWEERKEYREKKRKEYEKCAVHGGCGRKAWINVVFSVILLIVTLFIR